MEVSVARKKKTEETEETTASESSEGGEETTEVEETTEGSTEGGDAEETAEEGGDAEETAEEGGDAEEKVEEDPPKFEVVDANGVVFNGDVKVRWKFDPDDLVILGIDEHDDENDPLHDESIKTKLDEAQLKSVARDGVLQEVLICGRNISGVLRPVVIDGRHRTRWARHVNKTKMAPETRYVFARCVPSNAPAMALRSGKHTMNFVRKSRSLLEQGRAAVELKEAGQKNADIAVTLGVSVSTVENLLALASASKPVIEAVTKGILPPTAAYKLAKLPEDKQANALKETLASAKESGKRAKVADAQRGKAKASGKEDAAKRPSVGQVKRIYEAAKADEQVLKALSKCEPIDFLRWLLGEKTERILPSELRLALKTKPAKTES